MMIRATFSGVSGMGSGRGYLTGLPRGREGVSEGDLFCSVNGIFTSY